MSKHIRRTRLRSVALKAEDTALIWMLTSAKFIYVGLHTDYISAFTF